MIRIREILDPDLRNRIVEALADRRGCSVAAIPDWFELDDADYVDLLNDLKKDDLMTIARTIRGCEIPVSSLPLARDVTLECARAAHRSVEHWNAICVG